MRIVYFLIHVVLDKLLRWWKFYTLSAHLNRKNWFLECPLSICTYVYMHVCVLMYMPMYVCAYLYVYIWLCVHMYVCMRVCIYVCVYVCICVDMYIFDLLIVVLFCVMCVICVLCLIVAPLPPGKNPFAVKINNNNNMYVFMNECVCTYVCVYVSTYIQHICTYVCAYVHHICPYVCTCMYICTWSGYKISIILTANMYLFGGSGTTIRHNTQITHITQNNTTIKRNTAHKTK
jgi:hypothetical protein